MSADRRKCGRGSLRCTIENRADEISDHVIILPIVQTVWDHWSVRVVGPWILLRARHSPDVHGEILAVGRIGGGKRGLGDGEKTLKLDGRESAGVIKSRELNGGTMGSK